MRLGELFKAYRQQRGIKQCALASDIGIQNTTLCRIEQGKEADFESMLIILNWLSGKV